jgi:uncharacterized paraquat-inducible protein A
MEEATGIVCPQCGTKLRIAQTRAVLVLAAAVAAGLVLAYGIGRLVGTDEVRAVLSLAVFALLVPGPIAKRFATLKVRDGSSTVDFPVERLKRQLHAPASEAVMDAELFESLRVCTACAQETPAKVRVCLYCGRYDQNA